MTTDTKKDRTPAGAPSQIQLDDTLAAAILSRIQRSTRDKPATRDELASLAPARRHKDPDRAVRYRIQRLRIQGIPVCSLADQSGYWIAQSQEEYRRFKKQYTHHAKEIFRATAAMDKTMNEQEDRILYAKMLDEYAADPDNV